MQALMTIVFLYLDPGSGSLIFQALLSTFLTIFVFYRRIINSIRNRFKKN